MGAAPDDKHRKIIGSLTATLSAAFKGFTKAGQPEGQDFPAVALDVAEYNINMMRWYIHGGWNSTAGGNVPAGHCGRPAGCPDWKAAVMVREGGHFLLMVMMVVWTLLHFLLLHLLCVPSGGTSLIEAVCDIHCSGARRRPPRRCLRRGLVTRRRLGKHGGGVGCDRGLGPGATESDALPPFRLEAKLIPPK